MDSETLRFIDKWMIAYTEEQKNMIATKFKNPNYDILIAMYRPYIDFIRPYVHIFKFDSATYNKQQKDNIYSGLSFFYLGLLFAVHFDKWGKHVKDIFLYNILFLTVDHYIDDETIDIQEKRKSIAMMYIMVKNPGMYVNLNLNNEVLYLIGKTHEELINNCPSTKESLIKLFEIEIETLSIQNKYTLQEKEYYDLAVRKGEATMLVFLDIMENHEEKNIKITKQLGAIWQFFDDLSDFEEDIEDNIYTIANYHLEHEGNLDKLWLDQISRIIRIDPSFNSFIIINLIVAIYILGRRQKYFSQDLVNSVRKYNLFDYDYGFSGDKFFVETFREILLNR